MKDKFIIFTDGACSGNPGPGGWGSIVWTPDELVTELGDFVMATTNNRMEMSAVVNALNAVEKYLRSEPEQTMKKNEVIIFTDSTYVIRGITQWIHGWRRKGWKNSEGEDVSNVDIWKVLDRSVYEIKNLGAVIDWRYSRGHVGIPGNERCDQIAVAFSQRKRISLYQGPKNGYGVDILTWPLDYELPPMKPMVEKKAAIGYLSYVNGVVTRFKDWPSCQKKVNGVPGAKFKKIMSEEDQPEVLKSWGLNPSQTKINSD